MNEASAPPAGAPFKPSFGYVVMPEHVHLLLDEPRHSPLSVALKSLKQGVSRRLIGNRVQFWEKRYYDFNVYSGNKWIEKLQYLHRNPVHRGLCPNPSNGRGAVSTTTPLGKGNR